MSQFRTPQSLARELHLTPSYIRRLVRDGVLVGEYRLGQVFIDPRVEQNANYISERSDKVLAQMASK